MSQEICPFCHTTVNAGATVCHACGAQKGHGEGGQTTTTNGIGGFVMMFIALIAYNTGEPIIQMFVGAVFGVGAAIFWLVWLIQIFQPPKWYRPRRDHYRY